jgi:hypothetical protein
MQVRHAVITAQAGQGGGLVCTAWCTGGCGDTWIGSRAEVTSKAEFAIL